jgi:hypothetical protein
MIIKYSETERPAGIISCTWHIISGVQEVEYGYSKDTESMTKEEVEMRTNCKLQPPSFISYFKMYKNEGGEANLIFLNNEDEAFLMTDEGRTIERLR